MENQISQIKPNKSKALMLAKRQLSELVCDSVNLEGIAMTLPEVQTLLDGITVGGHKLSDELITLNQANAWRFLFHAVERNTFSLEKKFVCELHQIAAKEEALQWGKFRDGNVTIAGTDYLPPKPDQLDDLWLSVTKDITRSSSNIYDRAVGLFLDMARNQFFFNVNKRTGRLMMNGVLLSAGYPAINLPAKHQLTFNKLMSAFYTSGDKTDMIAFMKSCLEKKVLDIVCE